VIVGRAAAGAIVAAFDDALGVTMRRSVEWTLRTGHAQRRR